MSNEIVLSDGDVISMDETNRLTKSATTKVGEIKQVLTVNYFTSNALWLNEGAKCEVLLAQGGGWQKGRVRLRLEFVPDPPEEQHQTGIRYTVPNSQSPLDDFRSNLDI